MLEVFISCSSMFVVKSSNSFIKSENDSGLANGAELIRFSSEAFFWNSRVDWWWWCRGIGVFGYFILYCFSRGELVSGSINGIESSV